MLSDLVANLLDAKTADAKERAYKALERVGVDRMTADVMAESLYEMREEGKR